MLSEGSPLLLITEWVRFVNFLRTTQVVKLVHYLVPHRSSG